MDLLSVFWNRQHATGSIVYRPAFMRDMANQGPYFSPLLLNAILFVASKHVPGIAGHCDGTDNCKAGLPFRRNIEEILYRTKVPLVCQSSITTVQALLLFSDALFSWCDERSLSWHYLGIATNMIIDLGIHCENATLTSVKPHSPEHFEVRRRVFWAAFGKLHSIFLSSNDRFVDYQSQSWIRYSRSIKEDLLIYETWTAVYPYCFWTSMKNLNRSMQ
jgi:hypothetical protein